MLFELQCTFFPSKIQFMKTAGPCLILLATYFAVSGKSSFIDLVNDKTSRCTALNDSL